MATLWLSCSIAVNSTAAAAATTVVAIIWIIIEKFAKSHFFVTFVLGLCGLLIIDITLTGKFARSQYYTSLHYTSHSLTTNPNPNSTPTPSLIDPPTGIYHPFRAAFPNNSTHRKRST